MANFQIAMDRIEETDLAMMNFLGIKKKLKRVRRFWGELGLFLGGFVSSLFGGSDGQDMAAYEQKLLQLQNGQAEIINRINLQTTFFKADAEKKTQQIEWLENTQNNIKEKLISLQATVMEDSKEKTKQINDLKQLLNETTNELKIQKEKHDKLANKVQIIEEKFLALNETVEGLKNIVAQHGRKLNETNLRIKMNSISIDFNLLLDQFESEQKKLFYVIKRAKLGELDPYLLTPLNLIGMLENIIPKLPENEKFPVYPLIENARFLYNLITPEIYFYNYSVVFILKMPLVNFKSFELFKITCLPMPVAKNNFAFILPKDPFLVIDKNRQEYSTMSYDQYSHSCNEINEYNYLCKQAQPIRSVYFEPQCEVDLLVASKNIPDTCHKRIAHLNEVIFLQLQKVKSWIYAAPTLETSISIVCGSKRHNNILLEKSGFITLENTCKMRYKQLGIESLVKYNKPVEYDYTPLQNIIDFVKPSDFEHVPQKTTKRHEYVILPSDFKYLEDISVSLEDIPISPKWFYLLLLIPFIIIILVIILCLYKKECDISLTISKYSKYFNRSDDRQASPGSEHQIISKLNPETRTMPSGALSNIRNSCSDYFKFRVKFKNNLGKEKNFEEPSHHDINVPPTMKTISLPFDALHDSTDDLYGNSEVIIEEAYLSKIRKLKPKVNN